MSRGPALGNTRSSPVAQLSAPPKPLSECAVLQAGHQTVLKRHLLISLVAAGIAILLAAAFALWPSRTTGSAPVSLRYAKRDRSVYAINHTDTDGANTFHRGAPPRLSSHRPGTLRFRGAARLDNSQAPRNRLLLSFGDPTPAGRFFQSKSRRLPAASRSKCHIGPSYRVRP